MSTSRSRIPAFARWSALPIGMLLGAALVWQSSYAAFTATTTNPTNNWATGSVSLTDDDTGTAMFNATLLKEGSTSSRCVVVTYGGNVGAAVKLFGTSPATTNSLSSHINLTVEQGTGGSFSAGAGCAGFAVEAGASNTWSGTLASFGTTFTNSTNGFGTWAPTAATQTRVYKITYTVANTITNTQMASTASVGLTWEATA